MLMNRLPHWLLTLRAGVMTTLAAFVVVICSRSFQLGALALGLFVFPMSWFFATMPEISSVEHYKPFQSIQLFDRNDQPITTLSGDEDRIFVPLNRISRHMKQAVVSAEDRRFYEHGGADISSMVRAALANLSAHRIVEGGSTISQQLVKNLYFNSAERSMARKARELVLAIQLEQRCSKDKILEMYLNQVYFGRGAYGIEMAAQRFFGKSADRLNINESAFLAGMVKAPSTLSRAANITAALQRRNEILVRMKDDGYMSQQELQRWKAQKLKFRKRANHLARYPYFVSYVIEQLENQLKVDLRSVDGLKVFTHFDPIVQTAGEKALTTGIKKAPRGINQGALVTVDVKTGGILAMVGGVGPFMKHQWNRAVSGHTAGSSFKPFVYLAAFEKGVLKPQDEIEDEPITIAQKVGEDYEPKNFDDKFYGTLPVKTALAMSRNTCAIRVAQMAGIDKVISVARRAGITSRLDPYISLALGSASVSPLEISGAYACFVRNGVYIKPSLFRRIEDADGNVVREFRIRSERRMRAAPVAQLRECLKAVVNEGTGARARIPGLNVIGKTGTADGATDVWFVGATPTEVTAVWGGTDKPVHKENNYITGGNLMAVIWKNHTSAYRSSQVWQLARKREAPVTVIAAESIGGNMNTAGKPPEIAISKPRSQKKLQSKVASRPAVKPKEKSVSMAVKVEAKSKSKSEVEVEKNKVSPRKAMSPEIDDENQTDLREEAPPPTAPPIPEIHKEVPPDLPPQPPFNHRLPPEQYNEQSFGDSEQ